MTNIIATAKNTSHNKSDIWIEAGEVNYVLPNTYFKYMVSGAESLEDFVNEILFTVKSWGEVDNGLIEANF